MEYVKFFLLTLWYTLGAVVICGLAVSLCRTLFERMLGRGAGRVVVMATSIVGTPVHETGHALMCLLFGHKIRKISLWQPLSDDGNLGYVTHAYNPKNPFHVLGNLFIGVGPVFSGLAVVTLTLALCFPDTLMTYATTARTLAAGGEGGFPLLWEGMRMLPHMVTEATATGTPPLWVRLIGVLVILSVSLHMELSPADIKGALTAVPLYLLLALLLTLVCGLLGAGAMAAVLSALSLFSAYLTAVFVIVLVASVIQLIPALAVFCIRKLLGR